MTGRNESEGEDTRMADTNKADEKADDALLDAANSGDSEAVRELLRQLGR